MFAHNVLFCTIQLQVKTTFSKHFLQSFRVTKCFYEIIVSKHDFLIHLHLPDTSGGVETLAFQALVWVSTTPSGPSRCSCIENHV